MDLPLGYKTQGERIVYKLNKSIYDLRQAYRQWFTKFTAANVQSGFTQSKSDYNLFTNGTGNQFVVILVYVDDVIVVSPSPARIHQVQQQLQAMFKLKVLC